MVRIKISMDILHHEIQFYELVTTTCENVFLHDYVMI